MSDQAGGGWLSPFLQKQRLAAALPHVHGDVLDYGCGNGELYGRLNPSLRSGYVSFDVDPEVVTLARQRWPDGVFVDELADSQERRFDCIVSLAVVEHVPSVSGYLETLRDLLNPGGAIILTSPNEAFDSIHRVGARIGLFSLEASDEHNEYVSKDSMRAYCETLGLHLALHRPFLLGANQLFVIKHATA